MKIKISAGRIVQTLTFTAVIPLVALAFTGCESMSPEGADVFDAAAVKPRSAAVQVPPAAAAAPSPRLEYPASGTVHPSELPSLPVVQPMPIPVPVPRR